MKFVRFLARLVFFLCCVAFILTALVVSSSPSLPAMKAPSPEDVQATRDLMRDLRKKTSQVSLNDNKQPVVASLATMNAALRMGVRMVRGVRAQATIENNQLWLHGSYPIGSLGWVNVEMAVPEFEDEPEIARLKIGRLTLPPSVSLAFIEIGLDLYLGAGSANKLTAAIPGVAIYSDRLETRVSLNKEGRGELADQLFGALRGGDMPAAEMIDDYYIALRQAMDSGKISNQGSLLPHLRFVLSYPQTEVLSERRENDIPSQYTAAIFALNKACGASTFHRVVARLVPGLDPEKEKLWRKSCDQITLAGRVDSKLHFITAAAIQAASNRGVAISVGEFKELFDTLSGGSGFDFTDIAANHSGIRFSDWAMNSSPEDWAIMLEQLRRENVILPSFKDIPSRMTRKDFTARYTNVNSKEYQAEIERIETKIDALPLYNTGTTRVVD